MVHNFAQANLRLKAPGLLGHIIKKGKGSMHAILARYEAYLLTEKRVSRNTFVAYKKDLEQLVLFLAANHIPSENLGPEHLKDFLWHMYKQGLAARSMARKISSLKVFFTYAQTYLGWKNSADDLSFPKIEKRLPHFLTEQELSALFYAAEHDMSEHALRNKVMLYLLYVTGMRISELTSLSVSHIDFEQEQVRIEGKGGKWRIVPIPSFMMPILKDYMQKCLHGQQEGKSKKNNGREYLFPIYYGGKIRPLSRQAFWYILQQLWKKTGINKTISPHQLRHTLATHLLHQGADLRSLQLILGHENLATVQIYTHLETGYLRKVYDKKHPRA